MRFVDVTCFLKAARPERSLITLTSILAGGVISGGFCLGHLVLGGIATCLYAVAGTLNAKKDGDFQYYPHFTKILVLLGGVSLGCALISRVHFASWLLGLLALLFYNYVSRYVLFADLCTLGFAHVTMPLVCSVLLNRRLYDSDLLFVAYVSMAFFLFIAIRNNHDEHDDRERGYATLPVYFGMKGVYVSYVLHILGCLLMGLSPLVLQKENPFMICLMLLALVQILLLFCRGNVAYSSSRFYWALSLIMLSIAY